MLTTVFVAAMYNSNTSSDFSGTSGGKEFQILLELDVSHCCLIIPLKAMHFIYQLIEIHTTFTQFGYKPGECCHHACQLVYLFGFGVVAIVRWLLPSLD
jgi:hypothetical protein